MNMIKCECVKIEEKILGNGFLIENLNNSEENKPKIEEKEPIVKPTDQPKDYQGRFGDVMADAGCGYQWEEIEVVSQN